MAQGNIPKKMPYTWLAFDSSTQKYLDSRGGSIHAVSRLSVTKVQAGIIRFLSRGVR
jgi:hypothetical protein